MRLDEFLPGNFIWSKGSGVQRHIVQIDALPSVPTAHDVVHGPGILDPQFASAWSNSRGYGSSMSSIIDGYDGHPGNGCHAFALCY